MLDDEDRGSRRTDAEGAEHDCAALPQRDQLQLAYRDQVILFDTFYSRVWPARPLGVLPSDFTRATAIFAAIATGTTLLMRRKWRADQRVCGAPPTIVAEDERRPRLAARDVKRRNARFNGFTVQAVRAPCVAVQSR